MRAFPSHLRWSSVDLPPKTERLEAARPGALARAARIVRDGGLVAFPTETVYGLGASAFSPSAVEGIFRAKQRPHWDPLIVHVSDRTMLERVCFVSQAAEALMARFWPGPLTLLLPRTAAVPDAVTAGRALVGVRMPAHPVALELIRQTGLPIAAPSANTFGHTSPTTADHVLADLGGRIDAVLDGGPTEVGVESTVVEVTNQGVRVYRPGAIDRHMLETVVDYAELFVPGELSPSSPEGLPSPGVGLRHYAPRARLVLVEEGRLATARAGQPLELALVQAIDQASDGAETVGVMLPDGWGRSCAERVYRWGPWQEPHMLAQRLFAGLRELDAAGASTIVCPVPAASGIGEAIRDRLHKAARRG